MSTEIIKGLGWLPDPPDPRDRVFSAPIPKALQSVYLANKYKFAPVYDQGPLGSCVGNAVAFLVHFNLLNKNFFDEPAIFRPSRLFIYYGAREILGYQNVDSGAFIRDGIKTVADIGAPSEDAWPYIISKFADKPSDTAYRYAARTKGLVYERVNNSSKELVVAALMQGYPIVFGTYLYPSFMTSEVSRTGIVPLPNFNDWPIGGHAMVIVGYRAEDDTFICRNSWTRAWGQDGYCRMPSAYITNTNVTMDAWVIKKLD